MITLFINGQPATLQAGDQMHYDTERHRLSFRRNCEPKGYDMMTTADGGNDIEIRGAPIRLAVVDDIARCIARMAGLNTQTMEPWEWVQRYEFTELKK